MWLKKPKPDGTPMPNATPATAGSSGSTTSLQYHHHHMLDDYSPVTGADGTLLSTHLDHDMPASPVMAPVHSFHDADDLDAHFEEDDDDRKPAGSLHHDRSNSNDFIDPLQLAAEAAAAIEGEHDPLLASAGAIHPVDFGPPSPFHPDPLDVDDLHDHHHRFE
jgi:hypothetical protein